MGFGNKKVPSVTSILSHDVCNLSQFFPFRKKYFSLFAFFAIPGCQMRSEHSEHLQKGEISVSNGVATIKHFRRSCFWMTRFISAYEFLEHLPSLDFIPDRNRPLRPLSTVFYTIQTRVRNHKKRRSRRRKVDGLQ